MPHLTIYTTEQPEPLWDGTLIDGYKALIMELKGYLEHAERPRDVAQLRNGIDAYSALLAQIV